MDKSVSLFIGMDRTYDVQPETLDKANTPTNNQIKLTSVCEMSLKSSGQHDKVRVVTEGENGCHSTCCQSVRSLTTAAIESKSFTHLEIRSVIEGTLALLDVRRQKPEFKRR